MPWGSTPTLAPQICLSHTLACCVYARMPDALTRK